ncbi:RNA polymerase sigma factor [Herbidospora cretacea]|uniref:RNA polymerase sigma factor n=1 Tax=Herbidospora cretacea TaxID=28444 RepID=UPI001E51FF7A|nr:sigma factor-like helix-turn-helix DNA-binding protein [Herbidospora cretacea]
MAAGLGRRRSRGVPEDHDDQPVTDLAPPPPPGLLPDLPAARQRRAPARHRTEDRAPARPDHLTAKQRIVLYLRFYEDLPEAQIAARLGCSVGTVKRHTHDALKRLRKAGIHEPA